MFLIVGLGNVGDKYSATRHNVGFFVVDYLANEFKVRWIAGKGEYYFTQFVYEKKEITMIKPTTYMNNSGIAVQQSIEYFGTSLDDLLVVCDDFNLPLGKIRIRPQGSDGGHNGIGSIIYHLLSDNFPRLRIGIGDNFGDTGAVDFVLSEFNPDEKKIITESIIKTKDAIFTFVDQGIQIAMNKYN